jgi:YVTN family beta-propeller protein
VGASFALVPQARAQSGPFAYVPKQNDNNVSRIDIPTSTVVPGTIPVGGSPAGAAVRGDQSLVYVANEGNNTVSVIDTAANAVTATITGLGTTPFATAISRDGARVYVANINSNNVSVIDTATNTVIATIAVGTNRTSPIQMLPQDFCLRKSLI